MTKLLKNKWFAIPAGVLVVILLLAGLLNHAFSGGKAETAKTTETATTATAPNDQVSAELKKLQQQVADLQNQLADAKKSVPDATVVEKTPAGVVVVPEKYDYHPCNVKFYWPWAGRDNNFAPATKNSVATSQTEGSTAPKQTKINKKIEISREAVTKLEECLAKLKAAHDGHSLASAMVIDEADSELKLEKARLDKLILEQSLTEIQTKKDIQ